MPWASGYMLILKIFIKRSNWRWLYSYLISKTHILNYVYELIKQLKNPSMDAKFTPYCTIDIPYTVGAFFFVIMSGLKFQWVGLAVDVCSNSRLFYFFRGNFIRKPGHHQKFHRIPTRQRLGGVGWKRERGKGSSSKCGASRSTHKNKNIYPSCPICLRPCWPDNEFSKGLTMWMKEKGDKGEILLGLFFFS